MYRRSAFLVLACAALCSNAVKYLRTASLTESLDMSGEFSAYMEAEAEDRTFLLSQLDETEHELVKLQQFVSAAPVKDTKVAVKPAAKAPETKVAKVAEPAKKELVKKEVAKPASKAMDTEPPSPAKLMASMKMKKLMGTAALAPMLAMLKGMYEESKERISQQNVREAKSKKWFATKETEHKDKLGAIEGKFKNGTLSEEFRTNETRDETRYFTYWSRCRERQHRQFHTNLKIQHAMMMKTKKMIDTYEKALSPKASDQKEAKKMLSGATGMPEIVFLQEVQKTVGSFCRDSLAEVAKERAQMQQDAHESSASEAW